MSRLITGLPRSRTAWMSLWLGSQGCPAVHELLGRVPSYEVYLSKIERYADCCTYGHMLDEGVFDRIVCIHRDPAEVRAAVLKLDPNPSHSDWEEQTRLLQNVDGLHIHFDELDERLEEIHTFLALPVPFDRYLSEQVSQLKVEFDMSHFSELAAQTLMNVRGMGSD